MSTDVETVEQALIKWSGICAAHPTKCTIAAKTDGTGEGVYRLIQQVLDVAYRNYDGTVWSPLDLSNTTILSNPRRWEFSQISTQIMSGLYHAPYWSSINDLLELLVAEQANLTVTSTSKRGPSTLMSMKRNLLHPLPIGGPFGLIPANTLNHIVFAIACGDSIDSNDHTTEEVFQNIVTLSRNSSQTFASVMPLVNPRPYCHQWTSRAVERLPKPMNKKPKNVVLVIGNTEDVITPYSSARTLASSGRLGNKARLVKFNAIGHGSSKYIVNQGTNSWLTLWSL
jgi:hypothetical protein